MTWTLVPMPAPEELALGYTPAPSREAQQTHPQNASEGREMRRYFLSLFVVFGFIVGLQSIFAHDPPEGQRRIAELNLSERKAECRDCKNPIIRVAGRGD